MAWVRQLDSGLWAATYYTPLGRKTISDELKSRLDRLVQEQERLVGNGSWIDPALGRTYVDELWDIYEEGRGGSKAARARDRSHWRCHVKPKWGKAQSGGIRKPDVQGWVAKLEEREVGAATIQGSVGVLRALLELAVDLKWVYVNPVQRIKIKPRPASTHRVVEFDEQEMLLANFEKRFGPERVDAVLFVKTLVECGLRWEECAAIDKEHVDVRRRLIQIGPVMERDGTIRPYPKSPAGKRPVPISDELWTEFYARWKQLRRGELMFTASRGGVLHYSSWHDRIWQPGISVDVPDDERIAVYEARKAAAVARGRKLTGPAPRLTRREPLLDGEEVTPHDLRHTFGTRLADSGMPIHDIMELMGHDDIESAQIYMHSGDSRHDRAREGIAALRKAANSRS